MSETPRHVQVISGAIREVVETLYPYSRLIDLLNELDAALTLQQLEASAKARAK